VRGAERHGNTPSLRSAANNGNIGRPRTAKKVSAEAVNQLHPQALDLIDADTTQRALSHSIQVSVDKVARKRAHDQLRRLRNRPGHDFAADENRRGSQAMPAAGEP
jgi:hypothetical protein